MTKPEMIAEAQRLLAHMRSPQARGAINLPETENIDRASYGQHLSAIKWKSFAQRADMHYFVSRVLIRNSVMEYGCFSAHQCVENYLKAFLHFVGASIPKIHSLPELLVHGCRSCSDPASFLFSDDAKTVCDKYNPFYELARYPVQNIRPKDGQYLAFTGEEIILDYFVHCMRGILRLPSKSWDLLGADGHRDLEMCREFHPKFYRAFETDNLNIDR
jgi:HEPN domain-containing protein